MEEKNPALSNPAPGCTHNAAFGAGFPWRALEKRGKMGSAQPRAEPPEATTLSPELSPCLL